MKPLIVDPEDYVQERAVEVAEDIAVRFCEANRLELPNIKQRDCRGHRGYYRAHRVKYAKAMFWIGYVYYDPLGCTMPVKTPGYKWSFTGYKADNTAPGVIAHEIGHHVWECRVRMEDGRRHHYTHDMLLKYWETNRASEPQVTSYGAQSVEEDFAESMKLFLLNPDLLLKGRPRRYSMLADGFGLQPVVEADWSDVLVFAHEKLLAAACNWISSGLVDSN